jgi:hypothetical protein
LACGVFSLKRRIMKMKKAVLIICNLAVMSASVCFAGSAGSLAFCRGIWVEEGISIGNEASVDWCVCGTDYPEYDFKIMTNSTAASAVRLYNDAWVNGDIVVGADGDSSAVVKNTGADVNGIIYAADDPWGFMPVPAPPGLPLMGALKGTATISSSGQYSSITIPNGCAVTIDAPSPIVLYVTGDLILGNYAELQIVGDGSLQLYVGGNILCGKGSLINTESEDPKKLRIYGLAADASVDLKANGVFHGTIYAPDTDVILHNNYSFYGAVAAKSFTQGAKSVFYYDASLSPPPPFEMLGE